jgi:hypothetical protein
LNKKKAGIELCKTQRFSRPEPSLNSAYSDKKRIRPAPSPLGVDENIGFLCGGQALYCDGKMGSSSSLHLKEAQLRPWLGFFSRFKRSRRTWTLTFRLVQSGNKTGQWLNGENLERTSFPARTLSPAPTRCPAVDRQAERWVRILKPHLFAAERHNNKRL